MADVAVISTNEAPRRKARGRRAALKDLSTNEMSADKSAAASLEPSSGLRRGKSRAVRKTKAVVAAPAGNSFADDLEELQARLNQLRLEKEKAEEMLKEKDEMLKQKEEEQEKLQKEFKKLQKVKEFKPNMSFPVLQSLKDKEQETKETKKKNKDLPEKKKPSPAYVLWCKDQWNEVKKGRPEAEFKEISNILGARWKCLSAEEKKPYEERYQRDKEAYLQVVGQEKRENEAMKLLEEEQMQKTAMELLEQYLQFKQDLNETERQVWNDKAAEAMSVYKKEVKEYMDKAAAAAEKKDSAV
ncbi:unnamed protein product [Spirodela intermedia]|uniref:HMG box domain-containing protein n=1 Tax=Spirodela intermedia TaxID=51605 RepID=A0A7I8IST7_SPIIN|nr:unnamed protein product [Spirodela intermedia]CAA6661042.1 unnamed protein product [Spirodela intermedia]